MLLGAWELLVVAVAALLLLGPEKLPELMRTLARLVAQGQRLVTEAKQSVSDALNEQEAHRQPPEDRSVYADDAQKAAFSDWAHEASQQADAQAHAAKQASPSASDGHPAAVDTNAPKEDG